MYWIQQFLLDSKSNPFWGPQKNFFNKKRSVHIFFEFKIISIFFKHIFFEFKISSIFPTTKKTHFKSDPFLGPQKNHIFFQKLNIFGFPFLWLGVRHYNSFFSLGARKTGDLEWDMKEFARIIQNTWYVSKQQCSLVLLEQHGVKLRVKEGGECKCCELTRESGTVHHQRAKMWVTNTNSHLLTGLAFPVTALLPA